MTRGGKRNGAGHPALYKGEKAENKTFRLFKWEIEPVKEFIKNLRKQAKNLILVLILLLSFNSAFADTIRMSAPSRENINFDNSEYTYKTQYSNGNRLFLQAKVLGYYENGKYIDTSNMVNSEIPANWKYYISHPGWIECFYAYENRLVSTFYKDVDNDSFLEYAPKGLKRKGELIAKYKRVSLNEFDKLDANDNLVSKFKRKDYLCDWFEYDKDGKLITKHHMGDLKSGLLYQPLNDEDFKIIFDKINKMKR